MQSESQTSVTQNNEAQVSNEVENNANTGNNNTSDNTGGETNIETGDITADTTIENSNINTNVATDNSCCTQSTNITISGNGSQSNNTVNITNNATSNISQTNNAHIVNKDIINANTGYNNASNNTGNVSIITGNITASSLIKNSNINNSFSQGSQLLESITAKIVGNGEGSVNTIDANINKEFNVVLSNYFYIENLSVHNLNTGYNTADGNLGDVMIKTGDIDSSVTIENVDINSNFTDIDCDDCHEEPPACDPCDPCHDKEKPKECGPGGNPGTTNNGNGGSSGGSSHGSSSNPVGAVLGNMLPATGANLTIWMTLAALIMFFMGWYLRFRSGCAPGLLRV